jgi:hypothetical protein
MTDRGMTVHSSVEPASGPEAQRILMQAKSSVARTWSRSLTSAGSHPGALRVLERHRAYRRLLRRPDPPPALPRRQPPNQPHAAHHGRRPAAQPHRRQAYYDRKVAAGKTSMEAMRSLKRRLSDIVYRQMLADAAAATATGPGGHSGTTLQSSVTGLTPAAGSSDKPLPGPASNHPKPRSLKASLHRGSYERVSASR